jgi:hypothetical protein
MKIRPRRVVEVAEASLEAFSTKKFIQAGGFLTYVTSMSRPGTTDLEIADGILAFTRAYADSVDALQKMMEIT